jgi:hypothetical protein
MATKIKRQMPDIICYATGKATLKGTQKMATKTNRRRPDAITERDGYTDPIADGIHHAIKPLDKMATDMELKWGCDRLPSLVSPAMAAKFGSAKAKLDQAIELNGPAEVVHAVGVMLRGWAALDAEATKAGHKPLPGTVWCHATDGGFKFAIAQGNAEVCDYHGCPPLPTASACPATAQGDRMNRQQRIDQAVSCSAAVDVAVKRWEQFTGETAILEESGEVLSLAYGSD